VLCPDCSAAIVPGANFCHRCGRNLEAALALHIGDRRVVSALFADIVGYTRLVDELDPEEVRARVDAALAALSEAVTKFEGSLEKYVGDAVMAVFGAPEAHDDDAVRACLCALHMQASLSRAGRDGGQPLQLRVGIATGEVVAAFRELAGLRSVALTGECMTTAARLQQLAEPGEVLLDEATVRAAEPRIGSESVGRKLLRGQSHAIGVYRLRDERRRVRGPGGAGRLVGRQAERRRLIEILDRTAKTGRGAAVLVSGEPGIGKSRLLMEIEPAARAAGFGWSWVDNAPHMRDMPYRGAMALADCLAEERGIKAGVLTQELLFGPEVDPGTANLVYGTVSVLARDSDTDLLPEEGWSRSVPAITDQAQLLQGLLITTRTFASAIVAQQPRVVVVDDFHWLDPSTRFMLDEMVRFCAQIPLVVLTGARPPLMPDWAREPHVDVIQLSGLDECETEELAMQVGGAELEPESVAWLHRRSSGNPLFIGELIRTLRAAHRLERSGDRLRIDPASAQLSVPLNLRALMGARIDALPAGPRSVLEIASVIGVVFPEWLVLELRGGDSVSADLHALAAAGIVAPCEVTAKCEDEPAEALPGCWRFRHELFHDTAYGRLLTERKRQLHTTLADRLEKVEPQVAAAELAHHRMAASDAERALPVLQRAAAEAEAIGAMAEAEAFRQAARSLEADRQEAAGPADGASRAPKER
jgi:class 3 adenylate cyclase